MEGRPTGTVTFLFTDIEGSTRLWQEHGAVMGAALARHDRILREAIALHRGLVFSTAGDGFGAAFWTPGDALAAAQDAQRSLAEMQTAGAPALRVRMGVHTGTAEERDGDYFGPPVNRAARLMAAGHGGQILVSSATRALVPATDMVDLGQVALKDVDGVEHVWQLGDAGFPPLRGQTRTPSTLPTTSRSFVGRTNDRRRLAEEVRPGRVVTLTGVGGVGKTRLAAAVGADLSGRFAEGVWWCDMAPIEDPAGVVPAVAAVISARLQADRAPTDAVIEVLRGQQALVIVDNCEHLLAETSAFLDAAARACRTVAFLATSREPLGIDDERVWPVGSLDPEAEGLTLFVDRATASDPTFDASSDRAVLVELCRRLDGIPLAIELAAARTRSMTPVELLAGLDDRFRLLRGSTRGGVDRHRTMLATLDWSYSLLSDPERLLLDRLSVFGGTFGLPAVVAVCGDDELAGSEVADIIAALVDRSLVTAARDTTGTRFRLLETVRQYAELHLAANRGLDTWRDRHLDHCIAIVDDAFMLWIRDYTGGRRRFELEWDNLRIAVQHALRRRDSERLSNLFRAVCFPVIWELRYETLDWALAAAELPDATAYTLGTASIFAGMVGRIDDQLRLAQAGLVVAQSRESDAALYCLAGMHGAQTRRVGAAAARDDAYACRHCSDNAGTPLTTLTSPYWAAVLATCVEDPSEAGEWAALAEAGLRQLNAPCEADVRSYLAYYYTQVGQHDRGQAQWARAVEIAESHDIAWSRSIARWIGASLVQASGHDPTAAVYAAVEGSYRDRIWIDVWPAIAGALAWWVSNGRLEPVGVVLGFYEHHTIGMLAPEIADALANHPDRERWADLGRTFDRDQLVDYVLRRLRAETER